MTANLENSAVDTGLEKVSFHSSPKERQCQRMLKLPCNALISYASKVMLKILQARLQQYMNCELPDVQAGFRKGRGTSMSSSSYYTYCCSFAQLCLNLCDPMGYTVHGILQARLLEWIAFPFSRGSSQPRDRTQVPHIAGRCFNL